MYKRVLCTDIIIMIIVDVINIIFLFIGFRSYIYCFKSHHNAR